MDHQAARYQELLTRSTHRLLASVGTVTDAAAREPTALPGWSRGHVLTHLARNADAIGNLLRSARTGTPIPMYASREARDADIEAGAGRPAAELIADVRARAAALEAEVADLPDHAWAATVSGSRGELPARDALLMRLSEVEVHHADLGLGYQPSDWPDSLATLQLPRIAAALAARGDSPACVVLPDGGEPLRIIPTAPPAGPPVSVAGPGWALLAWLLGRPGTGLRVDPAGPLPRMPAW